jgi:hypothetical protein
VLPEVPAVFTGNEFYGSPCSLGKWKLRYARRAMPAETLGGALCSVTTLQMFI